MGCTPVRRICGAMAALVCLALLAFIQSGDQRAEKQMRHISDAVLHHDVAALTSLFSPGARKKAHDLDGKLQYFLSAIPSHWTSWRNPDGGCGGSGANEYWTAISMVSCTYVVTAGGQKWDLSFDFFTEDGYDPDYVGIYSLGVESHRPRNHAYMDNGVKWPIDVWASQYGISTDGRSPTGNPGVYIPGAPDTIVSHVGPAPAVVMARISAAVAAHDTVALTSLFSPRAREKATDLESDAAYFLSAFPAGDVAWRSKYDTPTGGLCLTGGDYKTEVAAMCSTFLAIVDGRPYQVEFVEFTANQRHLDAVGVYALGVTSVGADAKPPAGFRAWSKTQDPDFSGTRTKGDPGIYVPGP